MHARHMPQCLSFNPGLLGRDSLPSISPLDDSSLHLPRRLSRNICSQGTLPGFIPLPGFISPWNSLLHDVILHTHFLSLYWEVPKGKDFVQFTAQSPAPRKAVLTEYIAMNILCEHKEKVGGRGSEQGKEWQCGRDRTVGPCRARTRVLKRFGFYLCV